MLSPCSLEYVCFGYFEFSRVGPFPVEHGRLIGLIGIPTTQLDPVKPMEHRVSIYINSTLLVVSLFADKHRLWVGILKTREADVRNVIYDVAAILFYY